MVLALVITILFIGYKCRLYYCQVIKVKYFLVVA